MKVITTNLLNKFWKDGILPIKNGKINVSDIVNNLTTTAANKVLDARQGKALADKYDQLNSNLQVVQTALTSANPDYFTTDGYAFKLPGGVYLVRGRITMKQAIIVDHNAIALVGLPFKWKYTTDIPGASVNTGTSLIMQGVQGESSIRLGVRHEAWAVGVAVSFSGIFPPQYVQ